MDGDHATQSARGWSDQVLIDASKLGAVLAIALLAGCGTLTGPTAPKDASRGGAGAPPAHGGGYYLDDGPGANPPANLDAIPDAIPRVESLHRGTMRPYAVMGRSYTPMTALAPYRARGLATWYGRRYHGKPTSSGEPYDMYAMTAAHTVLPIPSYARVTNLANGRSVIVRINDRGPFIGERLIDLSYIAAHRLDIVRNGAGTVEVETILPDAGTPHATATAARPATPLASDPDAFARSAGGELGSDAAQGEHYVQLGAFSIRENAERFFERVRDQLVGLNLALQVVPAANLYKIQAGPYASRAAAAESAERIGQTIGSTPIVTGPR